MKLKDKVVLITGATSGIGFEATKQAIEEGAKVMIHSSPRREELAKSKIKELNDKYQKEIVSFYVCDLRDISKFEDMVNFTVDKFGKIDVLVNNAGVFPRDNLLNMTEEGYEAIYDVNVKAPLFLTQKVVKQFIDKKIKGVIVNIGSINSHCGQDDLLVYSSSKGALMTISRNLGDALGKYGIRVNQLNVGWTHSEKEQEVQIGEGRDEDWSKNIHPLFSSRGKILQPEEVARHVIFWSSDSSAPVSGSVYEIEQFPLIGRTKANIF